MNEIIETGTKPAEGQDQAGWRAVSAIKLCNAISACEPEDAAQIMAALDTTRTGGPALSLFGDIRSDAMFWADCAQVVELEAVVLAGLRRLGRMSLGLETRKRLFVALWSNFRPADQRALLDRFAVSPMGFEK